MRNGFTLVNPSESLELTEERWRRLEALFHAARELPEDARTDFIERETSETPQLRAELEGMLAHAPAAPGLLRHTVSAIAREAAGGAERLGHAGPYKLVREIGRGGMGVVFEALRDDDQYRKTVAIKIALDPRGIDDLGERLRHERQILAGLEHPNIARFLDGGAQDGVPYFAMEYVEGSPVTAYCRDRNLGVRARVALLRQVCGAIDYAHQRLVVHRDLKPANVLVTGEGVPKVLDFGIAKLVVPLHAEAAATFGMRLWTPDYTTPEQVRGGAVTTRTDVYLLGLVLYELLCGEKAQSGDAASPLALDHAICETDAAPPSQRAAARGDHALARQLRGDLDTIVAKALRKEPEHRYASAAALRDDLGRYLDGRPVEARPGSLIYRGWKLARRHRAAVAAAVLVVTTTTGGVLATVHQAQRAERRYQEIRRLANSMLFSLDDRIKDLAGATAAREWAARNALEYLDNLAQDAGEDRALLFELAAAYQKVGDVQGRLTQPSLGHTDAALESHRKALAIAERLVTTGAEPRAMRLLARAHLRVASLTRAVTGMPSAIEEYRRSVTIVDRLFAVNPGNPEDSELLASALLTLGQAEARTGDVEAARQSWSRAFDVSTNWLAAHPGDPARIMTGHARRMAVRGDLYVGDLEPAARLAREHIRMCEELVAAHPEDISLRRDLMNAYVEMAYVYWHPAFLTYGDRATAAVFHQKALAIARELAASDAGNATASFDLAITEADLCDALSPSDPARAIGYCSAAMKVAGDWPGRFNPETVLAYLADSLQRLGRYDEAVEALRSSIESRTAMTARDPANFGLREGLLRSYIQMGGLVAAMGDRAGALEQYGQALRLGEAMAVERPSSLIGRRDLAEAREAIEKIGRR